METVFPSDVTEARLDLIEAVSFDLDDTLWHCEPAIVKAEHALYEWHRCVTPEITRVHTPESLFEYRKRFRDEHPGLQGCVTEMRLAGLRALLAEFGLPECLSAEGFAIFYKVRSEVELFDGAITLLSSLALKYPLAAITNGNANLDNIGIARYFKHIYAASLTLPGKPAADMFEHCLADLRIPAKALLHIGDNPVADITGGHKAGVQTAWFNPYNEAWPEYLVPPHFEVHSLSEIVALLRLQ